MVLPSAAYTGMQPGPSFYEADNHARDLLSHMDLPPTPKNLKPLICHWEDQEDRGEGSSKRIQLMLDRELSPVLKELEISFGMEPVSSMEEIWSEVDQALDLDDKMGPLDVGGYDIRYLFLPTTKPHVNISTVPYSKSSSKELAVISFSTPNNVLFTCQHENVLVVISLMKLVSKMSIQSGY